MSDTYDLSIEDGTLRLRTGSYSTGHGSVLHSGIYNPELISSLAAGAFLILIFVIALAVGIKITVAYYIAGGAVFFALLFLFRMFVFYEEFLSAVIDRGADTVSVKINKALPDLRVFKLPELQAISLGTVHLEPENPDGVDFVKRISAQHGAPIPGFGVKKDLHTVALRFSGDRDVVVFSTEQEDDARELARKLEDFAGVLSA